MGDASDLPHFWKTNKQSLSDYINIVRTLGIRGVLKDAHDGSPIKAGVCHIDADNSDSDGRWFRSDRVTGDYFRVLLPGEYTCVAVPRAIEQPKWKFTCQTRKKSNSSWTSRWNAKSRRRRRRAIRSTHRQVTHLWRRRRSKRARQKNTDRKLKFMHSKSK